MNKDAKHIYETALMALSSLGDTDSAVELGHFGRMTTQDAIARLKNLREALKAGRITIKRIKAGTSKS